MSGGSSPNKITFLVSTGSFSKNTNETKESHGQTSWRANIWYGPNIILNPFTPVLLPAGTRMVSTTVKVSIRQQVARYLSTFTAYGSAPSVPFAEQSCFNSNTAQTKHAMHAR